MNENYIIRHETESDYRTVENLCREAFWNVYQPGCTEHYVLHHLRNHPDFVPELDFVMQLGDAIIGQVVFCRAEILSDDGRKIPILTFGPIGIAPEFKRKGYGLALLNYALGKARDMGFGAVCMEGNIDFYGKAGFVLASSKKIHYHGCPLFPLSGTSGRLSGWYRGSLPHPEAVFHSPGKSRRFRTFRQRLPAKGETETPGTDILIAKGPARALVFAIATSAAVFCSPRRPNSNFHPSVLLFSTKMAILTPVFCHFALQNSQMATLFVSNAQYTVKNWCISDAPIHILD